MKVASFITSVALVAFFIGCGSNEGACCESSIDKVQKQGHISGKVPETSTTVDVYLDKNDLPKNSPKDTNQTPTHEIPISDVTEDKSPIAVIDVSHSDSSYTISCKDSYDTDEDGNGIKQCNWDIVSYDMHSCTHKEYQRYDKDDTQDVFIAPCGHVKYIEVKLTVIDNEGSHDCVTQKIEVR